MDPPIETAMELLGVMTWLIVGEGSMYLVTVLVVLSTLTYLTSLDWIKYQVELNPFSVAGHGISIENPGTCTSILQAVNSPPKKMVKVNQSGLALMQRLTARNPQSTE